MPIITISRGSFSGGKILAESVAAKLGYRCIDREEIIQKAAKWGVSQDDLRDAIEKPPSFLGQSQHTKYIYLAFIQAALAEEARRGNMVYHGLAGHLLLGKGPHVLRARIIAPLDFRIARVQEKLNYKRLEAIAYIEKKDDERHKWTQFLYGIDWADARLYDLVLNLEQMNIDEACETICSVAQLKSFAATAKTQHAIDNLARASHVKAKLAIDSATSDHQFEVVAKGDSIALKGDIVNPAVAKKAAEIARKVPGVAKVQVEELELATRF